MSSAKKFVREFIYMDVERLYSLYSQVFEGVADQIVQSYIDGISSKDSQKSKFLKGSSIEAQVAEVSRRTENKILYDHMYNRLEEKLKNVIFEPSELSSENYEKILSDTFMIKIKGTAEIEDYNRMSHFLEKFNSIAEAIAYASSLNEDFQRQINEYEEQIRHTKDRNKKSIAREKLKNLKDTKKLSQQLGLSQDETLLSNLRLFTEMFYPDGFEVIINPKKHRDDIVFRGLLDKKWLRIQPDFLRALYGGLVEYNWIMVGQITYLPRIDSITTDDIQQISEPNLNESKGSEENPSMRDPFRNMFRTSRVFERMFIESNSRTEIIIHPLGIYREIEIHGGHDEIKPKKD